jgi:putative transposase
MTQLWQRLLFVLTAATDDQRLLQLQYVVAENRILRSRLPERISTTPGERSRLLRFGKPLGAAVRPLITIVSPDTFMRWVREQGTVSKPAKVGRPRTADDLRLLVIRLANENPTWGVRRIHGALKDLGLDSNCKNTVANILKAEGIEPAPLRGQGTWRQFVNRQVETLWACDFFTQKLLTTRGMVDCFVLFFLHVQRRRVYLAGMTSNPTQAWVVERAKDFCCHLANQREHATHLIRDFDGKFGAAFDETLQGQGIEVRRVGPRMPRMNAFAERWVGSIRREYLYHFVVFGEHHLNHLIREYAEYYNRGGRGTKELAMCQSSLPIHLRHLRTQRQSTSSAANA